MLAAGLATAVFQNRLELLAAVGPCVVAVTAARLLVVWLGPRVHLGWRGAAAQLAVPLLVCASALALASDRALLGRCLLQWLLVWGTLALGAHARGLVGAWRDVLLLAISTALCGLLLAGIGPFLLRAWLLPHYTLGLDHRPKPFSEGTNEDGIYAARSPTDFRAADYNIVFLGDSFTANVALPPEQRFPALVEGALQAHSHSAAIHAVNFGWVSSSPLLQARQLRAIGAKYHPDVVAQCLDLTDFHDDLKVAERLRGRGLDPGAEVTIFRLLRARLGFALGVRDVPEWLGDQVAWAPARAPDEVPRDRWFFLRQPWRSSEPQLDVTWRALLETRAVARQLGARYVLFAFPRYQQYNPKESPRDWEKGRFPASPAFLLAPFEFLAARAPFADFPVHILLDDFRRATESPLCFEGDPHWNAAGNRVAADAIVRALVADGLASP